MVTLPDEYVGSLCEIKSEADKLLAKARIMKTGDGYLELAAPERGEHLPFLPYRSSVRLHIINTRKGFRMLQGSVFISTSGFMRVIDVDNLQNSERRGYFRMSVEGKGKLYPAGVQDFQLAGQKPLEVTLEDVSLSGVQVSTEQTLEQGATFALELQVLVNRLMLEVRVMRLCKVIDGKRFYGLAFVHLEDWQSDKLCQDIFELQRQENLKRKRVV